MRPSQASDGDDETDAETPDADEQDFTDEETGVGDTGEQPDQDLAEIPDDGDPVPDPEEAATDADADVDEDLADPFDGEDDVEVDLADTTVGESATGDGESPFDGEDTIGTDASGAGAGADADGMASKMEDGMAALSDDDQLPEIINEGFARLAVVGLESGREKDALETEFTEVFESFRLGYFGSEAMDEYVLTGPDEEIDPLWSFTVSLALCSAVTVYMRPDGDEIVASAKDSLARFSGGVGVV